MRFFSTFIISAVLAIVAAIALVNAMMSPGEGSFGAAKAAPLVLIIAIPVFFCLIWFPVNLIAWLLLIREQKSRLPKEKANLIFSSVFFVMALAVCLKYFAPQWFHKVHFHYQLEDQFGHPIPDATIRRHNDWTTAAGDSELKSDAQGRFQVTCKPGESFTLFPQKLDYVVASWKISGAYSEKLRKSEKANAGSDNLIIIKMWKLQGAETLVNIDKTYKLRYTGTPINIDFVREEVVPVGGDVRITVNRHAGEISEHNPQDWGFKIEAVDGGLIETSGKDEAVTFAAPETGYQSSDTLTASSNRHGIGIIQQAFFVQSRNAQVYSKLGLSFSINEAPDGLMDITFSGVANPNGSRNWEATISR